MPAATPDSHADRLTHSIAEAALARGIGRSLACEPADQGHRPAIRGRRLLVPTGALHDLLKHQRDLSWHTVSAARSARGAA